MFNKLRNRLILLILGGTIFSIILVSIITNITVFNKYDLYLKEEQNNRLNEIIEFMQKSYTIDNKWTQENLYSISVSPLIKDFDIVIRDTNGKVVLALNMDSDIVNMHDDMMDMHRKMMGRFSEEESYVTDIFDLMVEDEIIGTVEVGHRGSFIVSEREVEFTKGINASIAFAAIISIAVAVVIGIYSSKLFSEPILKITHASNSIRKGDLNTEVIIPNNITELQELSTSINHLAKSLKEQEISRKRLTTDISHELRTPLTVLQSHIEAILDGIWEPTQERLEIFSSEISRLIKLVEQLKHLTDIENHKINLEIRKINISKILKEIVESYRHEFDMKNIILKEIITENIYVNADGDKISQIVYNMISNALKFTNPAGRVEVILRENTDNVDIIIKDTGVGIPQEDIPHIFKRLYRTDKSRSRKTGGSGIGLTIAKTLVDAHKGIMTVESEVGIGTILKVTLPKNI